MQLGGVAKLFANIPDVSKWEGDNGIVEGLSLSSGGGGRTVTGIDLVEQPYDGAHFVGCDWDAWAENINLQG